MKEIDNMVYMPYNKDKGEQMLREPYSKYIEDGIFEIRCKQGSDITRVLYFFFCSGEIILTNGFIKKTPKREIDLAKARREDYIKRRKRNENVKPILG